MSDPDTVESDERFVIRAPIDAVERMLIDASARPQWRACMQQGFETSSPTMLPGTTLNFVIQRLGFRSAYTQIVSQYVPGSMLSCRTTRGRFFVDSTYEWTEGRDGTQLRCRELLRLPRNKRFARWLVERQFRRGLRADHRRLKHLLETGACPHQAADGPRPASLQDTRD